jgi:hypothetical protein
MTYVIVGSQDTIYMDEYSDMEAADSEDTIYIDECG